MASCKTTQKKRISPWRRVKNSPRGHRGQFASKGHGRRFGGFTKTLRRTGRGRFC